MGGEIVLEPSILPLHPNHKLLYETIYDLKPHSIFEVGCGGGDHLTNLRILLPDARVGGCDRSKNQLRFLRSRHHELAKETDLFVHDITISPPPFSENIDLVYTQAVVMHISEKSGNRHLNALRNLFHTSTKYVVLMEGWNRHNFYEAIIEISREPDFPWESINLYINDSGKQILMIISNAVLEGYKELHGNDELLKYIKKGKKKNI